MRNPFNFKKLLSLKAIREGGRNPYVDWGVVILICSFCLIFMISYGIILYKKVDSGQITTLKVSSESKVKTFNQKDLDYIVNKFKSKSDNVAKIKKSYKTTSDPSI